jgi:hypothetical protein
MHALEQGSKKPEGKTLFHFHHLVVYLESCCE